MMQNDGDRQYKILKLLQNSTVKPAKTNKTVKNCSLVHWKVKMAIYFLGNQFVSFLLGLLFAIFNFYSEFRSFIIPIYTF